MRYLEMLMCPNKSGAGKTVKLQSNSRVLDKCISWASSWRTQCKARSRRITQFAWVIFKDL